MSEVLVDSLEVRDPRLEALNKWILDAVVDGKRVNYDRTNVLSPDHTQIDFGGEGAKVTVPHRDVLRQKFEAMDGSEHVGGTCRELAQWAAVNLVKEGVVDSAEVRSCATDKEAHYVVIADIDGQKYLVDIAYSQPVLEAVPVDGMSHLSYAYAGEKGTKQAFSGELFYRATEEKDGAILFTIHDGHYRKLTEFPFKRLTDKSDAETARAWTQATGSGYATKVRANPDGTFKVDKENMGEAATLSGDFAKLHEIAKVNRAAVKVVFKNS